MHHVREHPGIFKMNKPNEKGRQQILMQWSCKIFVKMIEIKVES